MPSRTLRSVHLVSGENPVGVVVSVRFDLGPALTVAIDLAKQADLVAALATTAKAFAERERR